MRRTPPSCPSLSGTLVVAAWLTVVVSITADVVAGSHPGHVAAVGAIALALGIARLFQAGRHQVLFGLLSSAVVAQPVLHAAAVITRTPLISTPHELGTDHAQSLWYVALTALVIAGVGAAEGLSEAASSGVRALCWLVRLQLADAPGDSGPEIALRRGVAPRSRRRTWCRFDLRRGPPLALAA